MSRSLAKSWRELFERYPSRRTTVVGTTAATERIRWPTGVSCVCVGFRLMSAPCSWWDRISRARRSPFSVLRCVFIFQSPIAESDPLAWLHRWSSLINPSSGNQPERTRSHPIGLGCWSKENKEKRRHCDHSPANGTSDNSYTSFFHLDADRNSEAIKSNSVSCMHHCYQGDHFLSLTFFFGGVIFIYKGLSRKKL